MINPNQIDVKVNNILFRKYPIWNADNPIAKAIIHRKADILHRYNSIFWNYEQLKLHIRSIKKAIIEVDVHDEKVKIAISGLQPALFWLENILFNIASLFDYLASFVGVLVFNNTETYKWNKLVKKIQHNNRGFRVTAQQIKDSHDSFINKLMGYRSLVIHEKSSKASIKLDFSDLSLSNDEFIYTIPENLINGNKRINELRERKTKDDLLHGAFLLSEITFEHFENIFSNALQEWHQS